jgi:4-hydroxy-tetrahydrodipicolinate synthase
MGIKDSSGDVANMMRMIAAVRPDRPDFSFLTGWEAVLVPMLMVGANGGTNATSGIVPEVTRKLFDLAKAERWEEAKKVQYGLLPLFDAMLYSAEFPEGFRAALRLRGIQTGVGRQPQSTCQQKDLEKLSRQLQCLLAEEGFVDQPVGGCPVQDLDDEQVSRIVSTVMEELRRRGM